MSTWSRSVRPRSRRDFETLIDEEAREGTIDVTQKVTAEEHDSADEAVGHHKRLRAPANDDINRAIAGGQAHVLLGENGAAR